MQSIPAARSGLAEKCVRACSAMGRLIAERLLARPQAGAENALRVEEKLSLGPKKMLYLVSCREKEFLIAAGADAIVSVVQVSGKTNDTRAAVTRAQKREQFQ